MRRTAAIGLLLVLAAAFHPTVVAAAEQRVPIARFTPLPANPPVTPAARAARDRLLGDKWADPAYVTLHWTGVSSFVVTMQGHLFLFDAWEIIGAVDGYLPLTRVDLAALDPEAVLVGHGHFDHAGDLGYVAGLSGAVVVGSDEICGVAVAGAQREGVPTDFVCAITGTMTTPAMGTAAPLKLFADLPPVTVLQHIHSAARPPGNGNEPDPFLPVMDPQPYLDHLATDPEELARFLGQQEEQNQGGTWMYHFAVGDFTLLLGDSAGPIFDQPEIVDALRAFPGCVDVMANAILGFDQPVSGLQDPVLYIDAVRPTIFIATHGDAWAPVVSAGQEQYRDQLVAELSALEHPPQLDLPVDPADYLVQRAYRVTDERWRTPPPGSACSRPAPRPTVTADVPSPAAPSSDTSGRPRGSGGLAATGALGVPALGLLAMAVAMALRRPARGR